MCILNCRNIIKNDFTSVSVKSYAVVDYCRISHENLCSFKEFDVIRTVELISHLQNLSSAAPVSFPDQSVITWKVSCESFIGTSPYTFEDAPPVSNSFDKFDASTVSRSFLITPDTLHKVNFAIASHESSLRT